MKMGGEPLQAELASDVGVELGRTERADERGFVRVELLELRPHSLVTPQRPLLVVVLREVETLGGLSAHAGQSGLVDWITAFKPAPRTILVHGEARAQDGLADKLWKEHELKVEIPARGDSIVF